MYKMTEIAALTGYSRTHLYVLAVQTKTLRERSDFVRQKGHKAKLQRRFTDKDLREFCIAVCELRGRPVADDTLPLPLLLERVKALPRLGGVVV